VDSGSDVSTHSGRFSFSKTEAAASHVTCSSSKLIGYVTVGSVICIGPDCRNAIWRYGNSIAPAKSSVDHTGDMIPSADRETRARSLCGTRDLCAAFCAAIPPVTSKSSMRSYRGYGPALAPASDLRGQDHSSRNRTGPVRDI